MSLEKSTQLLEFILEKERKERKKRNRRLLIGGSVLAMAGVVALGVSLLVGTNPREAEVYPLADLDAGRVEQLLTIAPSGLKVLDNKTGDTFLLRNVHQYSMLKAALMDESRGITNPADWEAGKIEATVGTVVPEAVNRDREREIRRKIASEGPLTEADIMPAFPGGESALRRYLSRQLRYPVEASRNKIQGTVYLRFVIGEHGEVKEPEVMRGIGYGCDEEAVRVVQQMPPWLAGEVSGIKVPVYSTLAINFRFL